MIDERRDTPVRVVFGVLGLLLLALVQVEVDRLVQEAELLKDDGGLPVMPYGEYSRQCREG